MCVYDLMQLWSIVKNRCSNQRGYEDCRICCEWERDPKAFCRWALDNLYHCNGEHLQIDKDLFGKDQRLYSPETCCFLPASINSVLRRKRRDGIEVLPVGVSITDNGRYKATVHHHTGHLTKTFGSMEEAGRYYRENKKRYILGLADTYRQWLPEHIYDALVAYEIP